MTIYKAVEPWELSPGSRVAYLGSLRTVIGVRRAKPYVGYLIVFEGGAVARFINPVTVVDEERTSALLARYV